MPEYFEIACLTLEKDNQIIDRLQKQYGIHLGENMIGIQNVLFERFKYDDQEYVEHIFSIVYPCFHKETLVQELQAFQSYVDKYFILDKECDYVVCCYEVVAYFLENIHTYSELTEDVLNKFPIYFVRKTKHCEIGRTPIIESAVSCGYFNEKSQDIFAEFAIQFI